MTRIKHIASEIRWFVGWTMYALAIARGRK
jgi:hypothetical protein